MARLVRCLPHKLENLSSLTKSQTQTCVDGLHPRTREHRDRQIAGVHWPASLVKLMNSRYSGKLCFKKLGGELWWHFVCDLTNKACLKMRVQNYAIS